MLRFAPVFLIFVAGCTSLFAADDVSPETDAEPDVASVPIAALMSEYPGSVTVVVEILQQDGSPPPRQVYQFIEYDETTTPPASQDPACGAPTELRVQVVDVLNGEQLSQRATPYACDGEELIVFIQANGEFTMLPLEQFTDMPATWQRGDNWPWADDGSGRPPPSIGFERDTWNGHLRVVSASGDADWRHLILERTQGGCSFVLWDEHGNGHGISRGDAISTDNRKIEVGHFIEIEFDSRGEECAFHIDHSSGEAQWGPFTFEDPEGDIPSFPTMNVKESGTTPGTIEMEHIGGDCITLTDYSFRIDGTEGTPTHQSGASEFCVGDKLDIASGASEGTAVELTVIDKDAQSQVYKKTVQI